jgi:hypothetical protein
MPKARKKTKKSKKIRKSKPRRKAPKEDGRVRDLLIAVVNKMGGNVATSELAPHRIVVARSDIPPFTIDMTERTVEDIEPVGEPVAVEIPARSAARST